MRWTKGDLRWSFFILVAKDHFVPYLDDEGRWLWEGNRSLFCQKWQLNFYFHLTWPSSHFSTIAFFTRPFPIIGLWFLFLLSARPPKTVECHSTSTQNCPHNKFGFLLRIQSSMQLQKILWWAEDRDLFDVNQKLRFFSIDGRDRDIRQEIKLFSYLSADQNA